MVWFTETPSLAPKTSPATSTVKRVVKAATMVEVTTLTVMTMAVVEEAITMEAGMPEKVGAAKLAVTKRRAITVYPLPPWSLTTAETVGRSERKWNRRWKRVWKVVLMGMGNEVASC